MGALETSNLGGGLLNPKQQEKFMRYFSSRSTLLGITRKKEMDQLQEEIPLLFISEPITESATENADSGNRSRPVSNKILLDAKKIATKFDYTFDAVINNIEKQNFEDTIVEIMNKGAVRDTEWLGIQGSTALAGGTDKLSLLLQRLNGWEKQSDASHIVDAKGSTINKNIFAEALRRMPEVYRSDPDLMWIVPDLIMHDYTSLLAERATPYGDEALKGQAIVGPFGKPMLPVSLMSSSMPLQLTTGLPAELFGSAFGPFEIQAGVNDTLILSINAGANRTIAFQPGTFQTPVVVAAIQSVLDAAGDAATVSDDGEGRIYIRTNAIGAGQSIAVQVGSNAAASLGLQGAGLPNTVLGVNAGTAGNLREGASIWLTNPQNLIWGMFNQTRMSSWYNQQFDRFEFVIYSYVDFKIENLDAFVKVKNVRRQSL